MTVTHWIAGEISLSMRYSENMNEVNLLLQLVHTEDELHAYATGHRLIPEGSWGQPTCVVPPQPGQTPSSNQTDGLVAGAWQSRMLAI